MWTGAFELFCEPLRGSIVLAPNGCLTFSPTLDFLHKAPFVRSTWNFYHPFRTPRLTSGKIFNPISVQGARWLGAESRAFSVFLSVSGSVNTVAAIVLKLKFRKNSHMPQGLKRPMETIETAVQYLGGTRYETLVFPEAIVISRRRKFAWLPLSLCTPNSRWPLTKNT